MTILIGGGRNTIWPHRENCVDHTILPMRSDFFLLPPPYYAIWNHPHLFGSFVQTMLRLCCAHLISLQHCQALTDKDGASNLYIDFLTKYYKFKSLRASKLHQWLKSHSHFAEFDLMVGFMSSIYFWGSNKRGTVLFVTWTFNEILITYLSLSSFFSNILHISYC